ncbi:MAG: FG-GAP repeat protein [Phycisphaerales bacterium]|nr:FG-GAP repeat protein [Phycisphaerales bacterium]
MRYLMLLLAAAASVLSTAPAHADLGDQLFKLLPSDGAAWDEFGISVGTSGSTTIVGAYQDDDNGEKSGSAYFFDTTTGQQLAKLLPSDGAAHDLFGHSVTISGTTAIVGAPGDNDNGAGSGSAYLFDATTGQQIFKLLPSDGAAGDSFGCSVAISGTTAVVGAPNDDDNGDNSGSAYLFDTITGQQLFKLLPSDGAERDWFGCSVAISGAIAIVAAPNDDDNGGDSGSAYLFDTATGQQITKLLPSDGAAYDYFGCSVAISGTTAIVGAHYDDDSGGDSGSAYLFDTATGQQIAKLLPSDGAEEDRFGWSVAISDTTAIVGAHYGDNSRYRSGSAYLFDTTTGQQIGKLLASDGAAFDEFGCSVAISGTIAIVGARWDDDNGGGSGSAYLFDTTTGQQLFKLLPSDGARGDLFGWSVAISSTTAVVGACWDDDNGSFSGSAYLFDTTTGRQIAKLLPSDGPGSDVFGYSVAISGSTAIVGAWRDADNGGDSGSAYLFDVSDPANPTQIAKLLASDGAAHDLFGHSVAISGTTAIVGAPGDDDNGHNSGSAYLFDISDPADPTQIAKLLPSDGAEEDRFGWFVAISGTTAIVGAPTDDDSGDGSGSAYLFDTTTGQQLHKLLPSDGAEEDEFGYSVAISGTTAIVGARGDDDNGGDSGSAYLFDTTTGQQRLKLLPSDGWGYDWFGNSVAISGTTAIVGAWRDDDNGERSGSAYLFDTTTGQQLFKFLPSDGAAEDYFGISVAISGATAIIGAWGDDDNGERSGSAYVFDAGGAPCLGDLDGDSDVDENDLGILLACYNIDDGGDCDDDGDTDQNDLGVLLAYYGTVCE